jgi:cation diffusion facilitator family transporter
MNADSNRAIVAAALANFGIAVAKFVGFFVTGASSMLAEGVHSVADSGNQLLLLWGGKAARRAPTPLHPFGHGRERYFWSFVVALVIFALGAVFAVWEGVHKLGDPTPLTSPAWAIGILAFGVALESFSFATAIRESRALKGNATWWQFIRHSRNPELPVVLLEDLGALVGLVVALAGVGLATLTGQVVFDAVATIAIGALLGVIAIVLSLEMKSLLIGEGAAPADVERLRGAIEGTAGVRRVIHLRTLHMGPEELLVATKVELEPMDLAALARTVDAIEAALRAARPVRQVIYVEPDLWREPAPAGLTAGDPV